MNAHFSNRLTRIGLLLLASIALYGQTTGSQIVSVQTFGALGDGMNDDRPAIQAALDYAQTLGQATVVFPAGTYLLRSSTAAYGQLKLAAWGTPFSVNLIGTNATLETAMTGSPVLEVEGFWRNSKIQGLTFLNTHGLTADQTTGIEFAGGAPNAVTNWTITHNTFRNFSRGVTVWGVTGLTVSNNTFLLDKGRDSGTGVNVAQPTVGIWMFDNSPNGMSDQITIQGNTYNGCLTAGTASKLCGDGFVLGMARHATVTQNVVSGFSFEGIFLQTDLANGVKFPSQISITNNLLHATAVTGDVAGGGQWGIRCDTDACSISQNTITDAITGIEVYTADKAANASGTNISGNIVTLAVPKASALLSVTSLFTPASNTGISVTGANGIQISGNQIVFPDVRNSLSSWKMDGIFLTGADGASRISLTPAISANTIKANGPAATGALNGLRMQWTTNYNVQSNTISGTNVGILFLNMGALHPGALAGSNSIYQTTYETLQQ